MYIYIFKFIPTVITDLAFRFFILCIVYVHLNYTLIFLQTIFVFFPWSFSMLVQIGLVCCHRACISFHRSCYSCPRRLLVEVPTCLYFNVDSLRFDMVCNLPLLAFPIYNLCLLILLLLLCHPIFEFLNHLSCKDSLASSVLI